MSLAIKHKERSKKTNKAAEGTKAQVFHKAIRRAELVRQSKLLKSERR